MRSQIQPLARMTGLSRDPESLGRYIDDQLFHISLQRAETEKRVTAVQQSLRAYMLQGQAVAVREAGSGSGELIPTVGPGGEAMMPQLGESFLDRLVEMTRLNSDIEYRQRLTDRVINESVAMAALEREQAYYEGLSRPRVEPSEAGEESELTIITARFQGAFDQVVTAVDRVNAIYDELSTQNLNPTTLLYTVTAPFTMRTERALSLRTAVSYWALVFMLSLFLVPLGCLVHGYFQREVVHRKRPAERAPGARSEGQDEEEPEERTVGV